jgi:asparaginyl-tRNA synthetase
LVLTWELNRLVTLAPGSLHSMLPRSRALRQAAAVAVAVPLQACRCRPRARLASSAAAAPPLSALLTQQVATGTAVTATGWVRSVRSQKAYSFLELNDGTTPGNLQVVWRNGEPAVLSDADKRALATGASVVVEGTLAASPKPQQPVELHATRVRCVGGAHPDAYPVQKKAHTAEFLREVVHLRPRTSAAAAVLRVRDTLQHALHAAMRRAGCLSVNTPVLTANDCEGAGELFSVVPSAHLSELRALEAAAGGSDVAAQLRPDAAAAAAAAPPSSPAPATAPPSPAVPVGQPQPLPHTIGGHHARSACDRFFGKPVYLTVSGQLHLEAFACSLGRVYTFGPTFRAENSNTTRHAAEFWMLEPELAPGTMADAVSGRREGGRMGRGCVVEGKHVCSCCSCGLIPIHLCVVPLFPPIHPSQPDTQMDLAEAAVKASLGAVLAERPLDVAFLTDKVDPTLAGRLAACADPSAPFARMSYTAAVDALRASGAPFKAPVEWGAGLASEHERWLAEVHVGGRPLFVTDYPAGVKPFYMKASAAQATAPPPPGPTVQAFDLLLPGLGELVGGSAREDDHGVLAQRMAAAGLLSPARAAAVAAGDDAAWAAPPADCDAPYLDWYLDLRRFGSVPHAGFGLGFERLVMFATGAGNIRDVLPVPRVPDSCRM